MDWRPLPDFAYPSGQGFPALGENALGTTNGLWFDGSERQNGDTGTASRSRWSYWNDIFAKPLTLSPTHFSPRLILPPSAPYIPPGLLRPEHAWERRMPTAQDFVRQHPAMPFVPFELLQDGLKNVTPSVPSSSALQNTLRSEFTGNCLQVLALDPWDLELLFYPSLDRKHLYFAHHFREGEAVKTYRKDESLHEIQQILLHQQETLLVRTLHDLRLYQLKLDEAPKKMHLQEWQTINGFHGQVSDVAFAGFPGFHQVVVTTDHNSIELVCFGESRRRIAISPGFSQTEPGRAYRHVEFAHHPRTFMVQSQKDIVLKDTRTRNGKATVLMEGEKYTNIRMHPTDPNRFVFGSDRHVSLGDLRFPNRPLLHWPHYETLAPPAEFSLLPSHDRDHVVFWSPGTHRGASVHVCFHSPESSRPPSGSLTPLIIPPTYNVQNISSLAQLGYLPPMAPPNKLSRRQYDVTPTLVDFHIRATNSKMSRMTEWRTYHRLADGSLHVHDYQIGEDTSPEDSDARRYVPNSTVALEKCGLPERTFDMVNISSVMEELVSISLDDRLETIHAGGERMDNGQSRSLLNTVFVLPHELEPRSIQTEEPISDLRLALKDSRKLILSDAYAFPEEHCPRVKRKNTFRSEYISPAAKLLQERWGQRALYEPAPELSQRGPTVTLSQQTTFTTPMHSRRITTIPHGRMSLSQPAAAVLQTTPIPSPMVATQPPPQFMTLSPSMDTLVAASQPISSSQPGRAKKKRKGFR